MESEENVLYAMKELGLELIDIDKKFKKYASSGSISILPKEKADFVLRFDPVINKESIGFFIAKFIKKL